jgi:hypothetical protein
VRHEASGEAHGEVVAIRAGIQYVIPGTQRRRDSRHVGEELTGEDRLSGAVSDDRVGR